MKPCILLLFTTIIYSVTANVVVVDAPSSIENSTRNCYQCNSHTDPECRDLHEYPPHLVSDFYKPCEGDFKGRPPFCRTTTIKIKDTEVIDGTRVVRSCGYLPSDEPCYSTDDAFRMEHVCQCFTDGCNSSGIQNAIASASIVLFLCTIVSFNLSL